MYHFQHVSHAAPPPGGSSHHTKWETMDVDKCGEPWVTYITEDDTVETITARVAGLSGIPVRALKLSYLHTPDVVPVPLEPQKTFDEGDEAAAAGGTELAAHVVEAQAALAALPGEDTWAHLTRIFPGVTRPLKVRTAALAQLRADAAYSTRRTAHVPDRSLGSLPAYFPIAIGVEHAGLGSSAVSTSRLGSDLFGRFRKGQTSIKIKG